MGVFTGKGQCSDCHAGAELTNAATAAVTQSPITDGHDTGFENIGVRDPKEDVGLGGFDGLAVSKPLSTAGAPAGAVDGMFKIPSLRNVALTAPYFHNGSAATLRQVVEFYNRGGNVDAPNKANQIKPLNLNDTEKDDLVAFLQALTDPRVMLQQAPFDHPELLIPHGASPRTSTSSCRRSAPAARRRSSSSRTTRSCPASCSRCLRDRSCPSPAPFLPRRRRRPTTRPPLRRRRRRRTRTPTRP